MTRHRRFPHHLERQLAARLRRRTRVIRTLVLEQLHALPRFDSAGRQDSRLGDLIRGLAGRLRHALGLAQPIPATSLAPVARAIDHSVTTAVLADLSAQLPGADLRSVVEAGTDATRQAVWLWTREAAIRISEIESATVERAIEAAAVAADAGGDPAVAARDALTSAEDRAALLARDATGDLVATVTEIRAGQLGSDEYIWRSQGDHRVRHLHQQLDGTVQSWSHPHPTEGFPGQPWNCRCWAEAIQRQTP